MTLLLTIYENQRIWKRNHKMISGGPLFNATIGASINYDKAAQTCETYIYLDMYMSCNIFLFFYLQWWSVIIGFAQ